VFVYTNESNTNRNLQVHRSCFKIAIFQVRSDIEMQMALFIYGINKRSDIEKK
jgi:hypothetical protein